MTFFDASEVQFDTPKKGGTFLDSDEITFDDQTDFATQGKVKPSIYDGELYADRTQPANVTEAIATGTDPLFPTDLVPHGIIPTAKEVGKSLYKSGTSAISSIGNLIEGDPLDVNRSDVGLFGTPDTETWTDEEGQTHIQRTAPTEQIVAEQSGGLRGTVGGALRSVDKGVTGGKFEEDSAMGITGQVIENLPRSMMYMVPNLLPGGGSVSNYLMYQDSYLQRLKDLREAKEQGKIEMSEDEMQAAAAKYGVYEAGFEMAGNSAQASIIKAGAFGAKFLPMGGSASVVRNFVAKVAGTNTGQALFEDISKSATKRGTAIALHAAADVPFEGMSEVGTEKFQAEQDLDTGMVKLPIGMTREEYINKRMIEAGIVGGVSGAAVTGGFETAGQISQARQSTRLKEDLFSPVTPEKVAEFTAKGETLAQAKISAAKSRVSAANELMAVVDASAIPEEEKQTARTNITNAVTSNSALPYSADIFTAPVEPTGEGWKGFESEPVGMVANDKGWEQFNAPAEAKVEVPDTGISNGSVSVDDAIAAANETVNGTVGSPEHQADLLSKLGGATTTEEPAAPAETVDQIIAETSQGVVSPSVNEKAPVSPEEFTPQPTPAPIAEQAAAAKLAGQDYATFAQDLAAKRGFQTIQSQLATEGHEGLRAAWDQAPGSEQVQAEKQQQIAIHGQGMKSWGIAANRLKGASRDSALAKVEEHRAALEALTELGSAPGPSPVEQANTPAGVAPSPSLPGETSQIETPVAKGESNEVSAVPEKSVQGETPLSDVRDQTEVTFPHEADVIADKAAQDLIETGLEPGHPAVEKTREDRRKHERTPDAETGLIERRHHGPTLKRAWDLHDNQGSKVAYAIADIHNLGGLNELPGGEEEANTHFRAMADILREGVSQFKGAQVIRKGGDELAVIAPGVSKEDLTKALKVVHGKIQAYAKENGLSDLAHPKGKAPGTGLHIGVSEFGEADSAKTAIELASVRVKKAKEAAKEVHHVGQVAPEGNRNGAPGGPTTVSDNTGVGEKGTGTSQPQKEKVAKPKGPRNLFSDIKQGGGITPESLAKFIDPKETSSARYLRIKSKNGIGLDLMARDMRDQGWNVTLDVNGEVDTQSFADMVRAQASGNPVIHPDDVEAILDRFPELSQEDVEESLQAVDHEADTFSEQDLTPEEANEALRLFDEMFGTSEPETAAEGSETVSAVNEGQVQEEGRTEQKVTRWWDGLKRSERKDLLERAGSTKTPKVRWDQIEPAAQKVILEEGGYDNGRSVPVHVGVQPSVRTGRQDSTTLPDEGPFPTALAEQKAAGLSRAVGETLEVATDLTPEQKDVLKISAALGIQKPIFVKQSTRFNGVYWGGNIFLAQDTTHPMLVVVGHEITHSFERSDGYTEVMDKIIALADPEARATYHEWLETNRKRDLSTDEVNREIIADLTATRWHDKEFWRGLSKVAPKLFRAIADAIDRLLDTGKRNGLDVTDLFPDLEAVKKIIDPFLYENMDKESDQGNPMKPVLDDVQFSVKGKRLRDEETVWSNGWRTYKEFGVWRAEGKSGNNLSASQVSAEDAIRLSKEFIGFAGPVTPVAQQTENLGADDLVSKYSIDPEDVPVKGWAGRVMFHGTEKSSAESIHKKIDLNKTTAGYFGKGLYLASDYGLAKSNYADMSGDESGGSVIAIKIKDTAKILDLRDEVDSMRWDVLSKKGNLLSSDSLPIIMKKAGVDGLFDRSFGGVVIYNPAAVTTIKTGIENGPLFSTKQTETPEFKAWFKNSRVVDEDGNPLVVYHGTPADFDAFSDEHTTSRTGGFVGAFMFTESTKYAAEYANKTGRGGNIMPVYIKIENPVPDRVAGDIKKSAIAKGITIAEESLSRGYDGKIVRADGRKAYIVYSPTQIKSAIGNRGSFDPTNPDIRYSLKEARERLQPFRSKLAEVVEQKMSGRMFVPQLRSMLRNNGVTEDEIGTVLGEFDEGKAVTKAEVLEAIQANSVELEDVVLGEPDMGDVEAWWNDEGGANEETPYSELSPAEQSEAHARYQEEVGDFREDVTHFSQYTEPGAAAGSYREMFVTAPGLGLSSASVITTTPAKNGVDAFLDGERMGRWPTEEEARSDLKEHPNYKKRVAGEAGKWQDGHSQYESITNPIVRIRFNERETEQGKILFVEEMQGPSFANQKKMPSYLVKRIYDIGVKRVLAYAKENGFDGVSFTTGAMQAARYDLSKQVDEIAYQPNEDGTYKVSAEKDGHSLWTESRATDKTIEEYLGKEIAKKISDGEGASSNPLWDEATKPQGIGELADNVYGTKMAFLMPLDTVDGSVLSMLQHDQVKQAVISLLPVDVMNILSANHLSADSLFHNKDMVFGELAINERSPVAVGVVNAMRDVGASLGAKLSTSLEDGRGDVALLPALRTSDLSAREIVGIVSPGRIFHLGTDGIPQKTRPARSGAEPLPSKMGRPLVKNLNTTELAKLLNIHADILNQSKDSVKQKYHESEKILSGLDLSIGGAGLKALYDRTLPALFKKYGKEGVGKTSIGEKNARPVVERGFTSREAAEIFLKRNHATEDLQVRQNRETGFYDIINPGTQSTLILVPYIPITDKTPASYPMFSVKQKRESVNPIGRDASGETERHPDLSQRGAITPDGVPDETRTAFKKVSHLIQGPAFLDALDYLRELQRSSLNLRGESSDRVGGRASTDKSTTQDAASDTKFFSDIVHRKSFLEHGFSGLDIKTQGIVLEHVARSAMDSKILNPVVRLVFVNMVDDFTGQQSAPEMLLHKLTMDERGPSSNLGSLISLGVDPYTTMVRLTAFVRAVESTGLTLPDLVRQFVGSGSAKGTDDIRHMLTSIEKISNGILDGTTSQGDSPKYSVRQNNLPVETPYQLLKRKFQNKFNRLDVLQEYLEDNGVVLSEQADVSRGLAVQAGKTADQLSRFMDLQVGPLIKEAAKEKIKLDDISDFLLMQHAAEANQAMRELHKDPTATAFGVTDKEAADALKVYKARADFAKLESIANRFRAFSDESADMLLKAGIISQEMRDAWQGAYTHYVPLRGGEGDTKPGAGKGQVVNRNLKRRAGHELREEHVLENIIKARESAIKTIEKNKVNLQIISLLVEANDPAIGTVGKPELRRVFKNQKVYTAEFKGTVIGAFGTEKEADDFVAAHRAQYHTPIDDYVVDISTDPTVKMMVSPMLGKNEVNAFVKGHQVRIQINDQISADALTNMGAEGLGTLLTIGKTINNYFSRAYTGYDPRFTIRNTIRDFTSGMVNLTGDYGVATAAKIAANYPKAVKEFWKGRKDPSKSQWIDRYRKQGGSTGASYLSSLERLGDDVESMYHEHIGAIATYRQVYDEQIAEGRSPMYARTKALAKSGVAGFEKIPILGHFLKMIEAMNSISENAFRVATFITLVEEGKSEAEAGEAAKNSTINFDKKGELGPQMGALWLFFNPAVQGIQRSIFALTESKHKHQAQALVGAMAMVGYMAAELSRGIGGDDDDEWEKVGRSTKNRNLVIRTGEKSFLTIPLPYEYGSFVGIGYAINDLAHGKADKKTAMNLASAIMDGLSPLGNPVTHEGLNWKSTVAMLPTVPKLLLAPATNLGSFGSPIAPTKYSESKPDSQNMYRATKGTLYEKTSAALNDISGGTKYSSGAVDVSPEVLKFYTRSILGGAFTFIDQSVGLAQVGLGMVDGGSGPEVGEIPMVSVLGKENNVKDTRQLFYQIAGDAKTAAEEWKSAKKDKNPEVANQLKEDNADLISVANLADRQMKLAKAKRDAVDAIRLSDMPFAEKRNRVKDIEEEEEIIYDKLIKAFNR